VRIGRASTEGVLALGQSGHALPDFQQRFVPTNRSLFADIVT
jgi:hypothetical protein